MKSSKELNFEILRAPIGDFVICAKAQDFLHMWEDVGSVDPHDQVALLLLRWCGSFCKMVHLARSTPPSLMADALQMTFIMLLLNALQWMPLATPGNRPNSLLAEVSYSAVAYISSVSASEQCSVSMTHLHTSVNLFNALVPPADDITLDYVVFSQCIRLLIMYVCSFILNFILNQSHILHAYVS